MAADIALAQYREQWLDAEPDARVALLFFAALRLEPVQALVALEHVLADAAFGAGDAGVAEAKLGWWVDELAGLARGSRRHPIAAALAPGDAEALRGAAVAASRIAALESVGSGAELLAATRPLVAPLAAAQAAAAGERAPDASACEALAAARVLRELARWPRFVAPGRGRVPLALLARHRVTRAELAAEPAPAAAAALARDLAMDLLAPIEHAMHTARGIVGARLAGAAVLGRAVRARPGELVAGRLAPPHWRSVFALWRAARRAR